MPGSRTWSLLTLLVGALALPSVTDAASLTASVLEEGSKKASRIAQQTMEEVRDGMNLSRTFQSPARTAKADQKPKKPAPAKKESSSAD